MHEEIHAFKREKPQHHKTGEKGIIRLVICKLLGSKPAVVPGENENHRSPRTQQKQPPEELLLFSELIRFHTASAARPSDIPRRHKYHYTTKKPIWKVLYAKKDDLIPTMQIIFCFTACRPLIAKTLLLFTNNYDKLL